MTSIQECVFDLTRNVEHEKHLTVYPTLLLILSTPLTFLIYVRNHMTYLLDKFFWSHFTLQLTQCSQYKLI